MSKSRDVLSSVCKRAIFIVMCGCVLHTLSTSSSLPTICTIPSSKILKEVKHQLFVVQWTWWTQHNCVYPCEKEVCGFYADRKNEMTRPNSDWDMKWCETKWPAKGQQPQMFRNCAGAKFRPFVLECLPFYDCYCPCFLHFLVS